MKTTLTRVCPFLFFIAVPWLLMTCDEKKKGEPEGGGKPTKAVLKSSNFAKKALVLTPPPPHFLGETVTLSNITGMADSVLVLTSEDYCGFSVWSANSQRGPVATEGRAYESFNLGDPTNWTSTGTGLRDGCKGGQTQSVEAYFAFIDFHLALGTEKKVIRVFTGDHEKAKAGDVLIKTENGFSWVNAEGTQLFPDTDARPDSAHQLSYLKGKIPFNDGGTKTILSKLPMTLASGSSPEMNPDIEKVVIDTDFTNAGIKISDSSSDARMASTFDAKFLDTNAFTPALKAKVTALKKSEIGTAADPEPTKAGNIESAAPSPSPSPASKPAGLRENN
jgi:hypothetical protein